MDSFGKLSSLFGLRSFSRALFNLHMLEWAGAISWRKIYATPFVKYPF